MAKKPQSKTMTLMPKPLDGLSTLLDETSHASTEMTGPSDGGLDFLRGPVGVELDRLGRQVAREAETDGSVGVDAGRR